MTPLDLDQFRAKPNGQCQPAKPQRLPRHRAGEWFLIGPIPGEWLARAARLPGKALAVALALWYAAGATKRRRVKLEKFHLGRFGVGRYAGYRGLTALERAGLVKVDRHAGRCPVVTILEVR